MGKIGIIIGREYFQRIQNKSFWVLSILGPVISAALVLMVIYLGLQESTRQKVIVVDKYNLFRDSLKSTKNMEFVKTPSTLEQAEIMLRQGDYTGILYIPTNFGTGDGNAAIFKFRKQPSLTTIEYVNKTLESNYFVHTLRANKVPDSVIIQSKAKIRINTQKITDDGKEEKRNYMALFILGVVLALLIYFFIFLYGVQIMRGVMEEKINRIVEVIISSVKPFQLMLGKITGIGFVGLTQFIIWIVLTSLIVSGLKETLFKKMIDEADASKANTEIVYHKGATVDVKTMKGPTAPIEAVEGIKGLEGINFAQIIWCFAFYFLAGYLMYGALFAAVGSAVDSETETQQFILPLTAPLIFSCICAQFIALNPEGDLAYWLSLIPFTSPVAMMVRLPFGVPAWQLYLSMFLLVCGFIFTTWLAGKIYKTGILMYGKKSSWKEMAKWLFYKS